MAIEGVIIGTEGGCTSESSALLVVKKEEFDWEAAEVKLDSELIISDWNDEVYSQDPLSDKQQSISQEHKISVSFFEENPEIFPEKTVECEQGFVDARVSTSSKGVLGGESKEAEKADENKGTTNSKKTVKEKGNQSSSCADEKLMACELCSARFTKRSDLDGHLLNHSREKPFSCDLCSSRFTRKYSLKMHLFNHSDKRFHNNKKHSPKEHSVSHSCECVICGLFIKPFSDLNFEGKKRLISVGRPTPDLKDLSQLTKSHRRHFQTDNYDRCKWLTGCPMKSRLFCWPCLLFSSEKNVWNKSGFNDLSNLAKLLKRHSGSQSHLFSMIKEKTFSKNQAPVNHALSETLRIGHEQHNKLVKQNRHILQRFIDVTCFLAEHKLLFCGHNESSDSSYERNYTDLVELIAKYDRRLKSHLESEAPFHCTLNDIQKDLIQNLANVVVNRIKEELRRTSFVSIILDETNICHPSQLSTILRYFFEGDVKERFVGFQDVSGSPDAKCLYKEVTHTMDEFHCADKLATQSYHGASVTSDHLSQAQALVKKTYPNALFNHSLGHRLDLVLIKSVSIIAVCRIFFSILGSFPSFFSKSDKRTHALDAQVRKRFPKAAPITWNHNGRLVSTVVKYREPLIDLFKDIVENSDNYWDSDTIDPAQGFLDVLKSDLQFNFLLILFAEIFPFCDSLFDVLQCKQIDIDNCVRKIDEFRKIIASTKDSFHEVWNKTKYLDLEPSRKRTYLDVVGDEEACCRRLFLEIIGNIEAQLKDRFGNFGELKFLELLNFKENEKINESALLSLEKNYCNRFDFPILRAQLCVVYNSSEELNKNSVSEMYQSLKDYGLDSSFSEVIKLCELGLTVPGSSISKASSFSALNRIETYVQNSAGQDRPSYSAILTIEKQLLQEMRKEPGFYDAVIDDFAKTDKGVPLHYK